MKKLLISIAAMILLSGVVFASPSPKDVAAEMAAGNTPKAEVMTREILQEHPESAKAHYFLGQILTKEGKWNEAYAELTKAANLDKSLSFASNDGRFKEEMRKVEINIGKVDAPVISSETHYLRFFLIVGSVLGAIGMVIWGMGVYSRNLEEEEKASIRRRNLQIQAQKLMDLLNMVASLEMSLKVSDATDKSKKLLLLSDAKDELNDFLTRNKKQNELIDSSAISRVERSLRQVESGDFTTTANTPTPSPSRSYTPPKAAYRQPKRPSPPPAPAYVAPAQPAVTNNYNSSNNSGNGFLEGMIIGDMMGGRSRETVVEREVIREQPEEKLDEGSKSSFDSGSSSSFDSGSDSGFDSGGSDSSSSFDSGSSSDNNW